MIAGVPTKENAGTFYIEWYEDGKRIQKAVGKNGHEAIAAHKTQRNIHILRSSGVTIDQDAPQIATDRETLAQAIETYLYANRIRHRPDNNGKVSGSAHMVVATSLCPSKRDTSTMLNPARR